MEIKGHLFIPEMISYLHPPILTSLLFLPAILNREGGKLHDTAGCLPMHPVTMGAHWSQSAFQPLMSMIIIQVSENIYSETLWQYELIGLATLIWGNKPAVHHLLFLCQCPLLGIKASGFVPTDQEWSNDWVLFLPHCKVLFGATCGNRMSDWIHKLPSHSLSLSKASGSIYWQDKASAFPF